MALSFTDLKKSRETNQDRLTAEINKFTKKQTFSDDDDRFWQPEVDKSGNGFAIIRFLPAPKGEDLPLVRLWKHSFQGPTGSWYIENCLSTIGKPDPVNEMNTTLWNSGHEDDKKLVSLRKRKLTYISNIYVVKDPAKPSNEGKVFLYRYGKKLFDKLNDKMNPKYEGESAVNPFDLWEGANLRLKIATVNQYRNYDKSEFDPAAPLLNDDAELEKIWISEYPLAPFVAEDQFKSYDDLKTKLYRVLGETETVQTKPTQTRKEKPATKQVETPIDDDDDSSEDEFFNNLLNK